MIAGSLTLIIILIVIAFAFDFLNGLHDAANSIATIVSTRVLSPSVAVVWAAFFNFIAFLFFGLHVAQTIGVGLIAADVVDWRVIFGALMGGISWNLITWWGGIPSSSSHALIGGLLGAGTAKAGIGAVVWPGVVKTVGAIVWSPLLGFVLAIVLWLGVAWIFLRSSPLAVDRIFRVLQMGSAALYSIGHGGNDAQKTMGIIAGLLYAEGLLGPDFYVPFWIVLSCHGAMALGTLVGGWRIVRTMGSRITRLKPVQGFCAETAGAATLYLATSLGVPVSTTHTITGAIMGVGSARRVSAVRWGIAGSIMIAWLVTLPAAAVIGAMFYASASLF
ncbi:MAG TPA: anion permease [Methyloceanibacter sp.]|jgi:PiT family inorganic phosphate transporter